MVVGTPRAMGHSGGWTAPESKVVPGWLNEQKKFRLAGLMCSAIYKWDRVVKYISSI